MSENTKTVKLPNNASSTISNSRGVDITGTTCHMPVPDTAEPRPEVSYVLLYPLQTVITCRCGTELVYTGGITRGDTTIYINKCRKCNVVYEMDISAGSIVYESAPDVAQ